MVEWVVAARVRRPVGTAVATAAGARVEVATEAAWARCRVGRAEARAETAATAAAGVLREARDATVE